MEEQNIKIERFDNEKFTRVRELVGSAATIDTSDDEPGSVTLHKITREIVGLYDEGKIKFSVVAPTNPEDKLIRTEIEIDSWLIDADNSELSDTIKAYLFTQLTKMDRELRNLGRERYWASVNEKVVELADKGYSNAEISGRLAISENTVRAIKVNAPRDRKKAEFSELEAIAMEKLHVDALEQTSKRNNLSAMFRDVLVSFTGLDRNVPELESVSEAFADKVLDQIIGEPEAPRSKISKLTNEDLKNIEDIVRDAIANAKATKVGKEDLVVRTMARIIRSL